MFENRTAKSNQVPGNAPSGGHTDVGGGGYRDRAGWLVFFGALEILFGVLVLLMLIGVGVGTASVKRWARSIMIVVSWFWLAFGVLGTIAASLMIPPVLGWMVPAVIVYAGYFTWVRRFFPRPLLGTPGGANKKTS